MGLSPINRSSLGVSSAATPASQTAPNPNPYRFTVEDAWERGHLTVALVRYPDCTTFDGLKILVLDGKCASELKQATHLDPHLLPENRVVARFRPDAKGRALLERLLRCG